MINFTYRVTTCQCLPASIKSSIAVRSQLGIVILEGDHGEDDTTARIPHRSNPTHSIAVLVAFRDGRARSVHLGFNVLLKAHPRLRIDHIL